MILKDSDPQFINKENECERLGDFPKGGIAGLRHTSAYFLALKQCYTVSQWE